KGGRTGVVSCAGLAREKGEKAGLVEGPESCSADVSRMDPSGASAGTATAEDSAPKVRLQGFSPTRSFPDGRSLGPRPRLQRLSSSPGWTCCTVHPQRAPRPPAPSRPEPTVQDPSPLLILRNRPERRPADARRRRPDRFAIRREPHPEAHASRSRPI